MGEIKESRTELTVIVDDKYLKSNLYPRDIYSDADELFIGAIKYLTDKGKFCEFLGFNKLGGHVVVIDGIKYCTGNTEKVNVGIFSLKMGKSVNDISSLSYETFFIVEDGDHDYVESLFNNRMKRILDKI